MKNSDELKQIVLANTGGYFNSLAINRYILSDSDPCLTLGLPRLNRECKFAG
jgi:hypothetical protein